MSDETRFAEWASEQWRPIMGFEGLYEISDQGCVRRIGCAARTGKGRGGGVVLGRVLCQSPYRCFYRKVQLWRNGQWKNVGVHQLVAMAFIGPCPQGYEVNHVDGVKHHNWAGNLEYVTRSGNLKHAYATGLRRPFDGYKLWEIRRRNSAEQGGVNVC